MAVQIVEYPNPNTIIPLRVARGHFATNHSHINYYVDLTNTKYCLSEARNAAMELAGRFEHSTIVDTILCLDGTEVIGACMASELTRIGYRNMNANHEIYVVTPEHTVGSQLIFRENISPMITDKNVLILAASVATGYTAQEAVNVLRYYNGIPVGICSIFARATECAGFPVTTIFDSSVLPDYQSVAAHECPLCKAKVRLDAMVNTFGISSF